MTPQEFKMTSAQIESKCGKIYGVTHLGTDAESKAYLEDGRVWVSDNDGGWIKCMSGVERCFTPNDAK